MIGRSECECVLACFSSSVSSLHNGSSIELVWPEVHTHTLKLLSLCLPFSPLLLLLQRQVPLSVYLIAYVCLCERKKETLELGEIQRERERERER